ncbi:type II secretion system protein GspD [Planctomycetaceae bacterium SH139]
MERSFGANDTFGQLRAVAKASGLVQQRRRRVALRVTVLNRAWLVATGLAAAVTIPAAHSLAQVPGPQSGAPQTGAPQTNSAQSVRPDAARAEALLRQAREALAAKNTELAITRFREAAIASAGLPEMRKSLMDTGRTFVAAGVDPDLLRPPAPQAGPQNPAPQNPGVQQATGPIGQQAPGQVLQTGFMPIMQGQQNGVQQVQALASPLAGDGAALFDEGMRAMAAGNSGEARGKFLEAWKYEAELAPEMRQQLQEKLTLLQPARLAPVSGNAASSPLDTVDQQQQQARQRLYREISSELNDTQKISTARPMEALDRIVQLRRRVNDSASDSAFKQQMLSIVDRAYTQQERYVEENRASIDLQLRNEQVQADIDNEQTQRRAANDQIAQFVQEFNQMMRDRRYHEAQTIARKVQILDPDSEIAAQLMTNSRVALRGLMYEEIQAGKEETVVDYLMDVERGAIMPDPSLPLTMPDAREWESLSGRRLRTDGSSIAGLSPQEEEIRKKLSTSVEVRFENRPLGDVLRTLSTVTGVPIFVDEQALSAARLTLDEPVNLDLQQQVMLKSALKLILNKYDLTWMIQDEVLKITSPEQKRSNVRTVPYKVADLVIPIPNFVAGYDDGLAGALRNAYQMTAQTTDVRIAPMSTMDMMAAKQGGQQGQLNANALAQYGGGDFGMPGPSGMGGQAGFGGAAIADFDSLMQLIQTTIAPDTWEALGGPSTMAPYRANLSLVVSTTTDVHEQIADLLASLRRLQNLQVTIEVRFITLSDSFYERIGIDFDVAFDDNVDALPPDDRGPSVTVGLAGENRLLTSDLDVQFNQGSFGAAVPTFGNFVAGQGGQIGFAILSDIEAFFFLEAAQGDARSNIMQAPKVTLFDGQIANINDTTSRPFVTGIIPVVGDFAVAQQPVIVVLAEGTQLNVQAVVSEDKRFVRLTLVPMFTQIVDVDTFTYEGSRRTTSSSETRDPATDAVVDQDDRDEIIVGTTVQQPSFAFTSVGTTVSVPDGGTILLGGIKRLRENRNEIGVPMLSKIPYVNRLFRNVGIGREANSLMMMVTPRIIIQEEEEIAQTGFDPDNR